MEPPAAKKPKKLATGARKPAAALGAGKPAAALGAGKPAPASLGAGARKPAPAALGAGARKPAPASLGVGARKSVPAKPQKVRGDLAAVVADRAVRAHLETFQRPFTAAQLWENTQKAVAKKEMLASCARLAAEGIIAVKEFQGGKVLLYYAEPDAMAKKHGAFATPEALCDVVFELLPETIGDASQKDAQAARFEQRALALMKEPTNDELDAALREAEASSQETHAEDDATLVARVAVLSSGTFVTADQRREAMQKHDAARAQWKRLRRVVHDACARVEEDCGDVDLAHLAGVFTDAEAGVSAVPEALLAAAPAAVAARAAPAVKKKQLGVRKRRA